MAEKPPSYEDAVDSGKRLQIRLEVWHFWPYGRSPVLNQRFAQQFAQAQLPKWTTREVQVLEPDDIASRDEFVPVQARVDFEHKYRTDDDPDGRAQHDVRELFRKLAPPIIYQFFINLCSKPQIMSLVPLRVPRDHHWRYAQLYVVNKLQIKITTFSRPEGVEDADIIHILRSYIGNALSALSVIVDIYAMYQNLCEESPPQYSQNGFQDDPQTGAPLGSTFEDVLNNGATIFRGNDTLLVVISTLRESLRRANQTACGGLEKWNSAAAPFETYRKQFAGVVKSLEEIRDGQAVTPQKLYQTIMSLHAGGLEVSEAMTRLDPQLHSEMEKLTTKSKIVRYSSGSSAVVGSGTGGSILLGLVAPTPAFLAIAGIACAVGAAGAVYECCLSPVPGKKASIMKFKTSMDGIASVLNEARSDVALVMCSRVFDIDLAELGSHEKKTILENFGVDVNELWCREYGDSLIDSGIDKAIDYYTRMNNDYDEMTKVLGLQSTSISRT